MHRGRDTKRWVRGDNRGTTCRSGSGPVGVRDALHRFIAGAISIDARTMIATITREPMSELLYVDMDGVLAAYYDRAKQFDEADGKPHHQEDHFYRHLDPVPGAIKAFAMLRESDRFETYILSRPSWRNHHCWTDKRLWVEEHLGEVAKRRLILAHDKHLLRGELLIDDHERHAHGFDRFIHFGSDRYPDWDAVLDYLFEEHNPPIEVNVFEKGQPDPKIVHEPVPVPKDE